MNKVAFIPILMNDYYFNVKYYRYMPASIFDALESSFISGSSISLVPENEFLRMITATKINDGSQSN